MSQDGEEYGDQLSLSEDTHADFWSSLQFN